MNIIFVTILPHSTICVMPSIGKHSKRKYLLWHISGFIDPGSSLTLGMLKTAHKNISLSHADVKDKNPDLEKSYEFGSRIVGVNLINKTGQSVSFFRQGERISITLDLISEVMI